MNELITLDEISIKERTETIKALAVTPEESLKLEEVRTETNKYIKSVKAKIEEAKAEYLKPFTEIETKALEKLAPLEEANEEFSKKLLEAKRIRFKGKVREEWEYLMSLDGVYIPFEELYDISWYGKPEKFWKGQLAAKIAKYGVRESILKTLLVITCTGKQLEELEKFMLSNQIVFEKEAL